MIRPLRRRHRWLSATLFLLLVIAAVLALVLPAPSAQMNAMPASIAAAETASAQR